MLKLSPRFCNACTRLYLAKSSCTPGGLKTGAHERSEILSDLLARLPVVFSWCGCFICVVCFARFARFARFAWFARFIRARKKTQRKRTAERHNDRYKQIPVGVCVMHESLQRAEWADATRPEGGFDINSSCRRSGLVRASMNCSGAGCIWNPAFVLTVCMQWL